MLIKTITQITITCQGEAESTEEGMRVKIGMPIVTPSTIVGRLVPGEVTDASLDLVAAILAHTVLTEAARLSKEPQDVHLINEHRAANDNKDGPVN